MVGFGSSSQKIETQIGYEMNANHILITAHTYCLCYIPDTFVSLISIMSAVANMTYTVMNLRRSARIADKYDDSFSYCETTKDDRSVSDFDFVPQRVKAIRLRRSSRIAKKYGDNFSYCEPNELDFSMEDAVEDTIRDEVCAHLRRSSRLAQKDRVDYSHMQFTPHNIKFCHHNVANGSFTPRRSSRIAHMANVVYSE